MNRSLYTRFPFGLQNIFYGWWIILACFVIALYLGGIIFYGFTAFFDPLVREFGWSYTQISFALSLRGALKHRAFLFLALSEAIRMTAVGAIVTHIVSYLSTIHMPRATVVLRGAFLREYFCRKAFGRLLVLVIGGAAFGSVIGPTLTGFLFDRTGSYDFAWNLLGVSSLLSVLLMLFIGPKPRATRP